jgi:hypothetical protein
MQQRRLRLGDILDDYCARERRVTNHAIVAMIEDDVKLTRCTTCDTEHEFKQGRMPTLRRKKDAVSTAYKKVLAVVTAEAPVPASPAPAPPREEAYVAAGVTQAAESPSELAPIQDADPLEAVDEREAAENGTPEGGETDEAAAGRVHRRLIRATLPRPENHSLERPVPEFTMRQPTERPGKFRGGMSRGMGARLGGGGRGGGIANGNSRGPVFGRPAGSRGGGGGQGGRMAGRSDVHRQSRGGQPVRHGKKHSK